VTNTESTVDNAFYQIFVKLVGAPLLITMKNENPSAYLDIFREFEAIKRTVYQLFFLMPV
jgi:PHD/YefM family antitoxin component YafN of YafNO toxin-antitoxin module